VRAFSVPASAISLVLALVLVLLLAGSTAHSQEEEYSLSWVTLTGGGTSSGGDFTLVATTGQPEVSLATIGGEYTLVGGVWGSAIAPRFVYLPLVLRSWP
jgi:cytochrome oxidase Cu insertion factor (SCO1/SenC/PrrC family)